MLAAASVILLVISAALNFYLYNRTVKKQSLPGITYRKKLRFIAKQPDYQTHLNEWEVLLQMMADPAMAVIKMKGIPGQGK